MTKLYECSDPRDRDNVYFTTNKSEAEAVVRNRNGEPLGEIIVHENAADFAERQHKKIVKLKRAIQILSREAEMACLSTNLDPHVKEALKIVKGES